MTCKHYGQAIVCNFSDACDYVITDGTRTWFFDWSDRFGPSLTNGKGHILANPYPGERSKFWRCVMLWKRQGKRSAQFQTSDYLRTAIWDEPPAGRYVVDQRGVMIDCDEPEGFDADYSERIYVDQQGNPWTPPKVRRRREKLAITIGDHP